MFNFNQYEINTFLLLVQISWNFFHFNNAINQRNIIERNKVFFKKCIQRWTSKSTKMEEQIVQGKVPLHEEEASDGQLIREFTIESRQTSFPGKQPQPVFVAETVERFNFLDQLLENTCFGNNNSHPNVHIILFIYHSYDSIFRNISFIIFGRRMERRWHNRLTRSLRESGCVQSAKRVSTSKSA